MNSYGWPIERFFATCTIRREYRGPQPLRRTYRPYAPLIHHEQEGEAEGDVPLMVLVEDAPLDCRPRACNNGLGVPSGRRIDARRADGSHRSHASGYEQYTHDGRDHSGAEEPHSDPRTIFPTVVGRDTGSHDCRIVRCKSEYWSELLRFGDCCRASVLSDPCGRPPARVGDTDERPEHT